MHFNPKKFLFMSTLIGSTLMSVSSASWFGAWMGLEINLLSFIPLMSNGMNQRSTEASLKYFLTQALGSTVLLLSVIYLFYSLSAMNFFLTNTSAILLINMSLLLKVGAAPFHFWFPLVMEGLNWMNSIILMTWQKFAPLILLSYNLNKNINLMTISIMLSALLGGLGGLNQTMLRKIMAFSSINHLSWILAAMLISENTWLMYYFVYILLSTAVMMYFMLNNMFHLNQIHGMINTNKINNLMFKMNLLSLGGLPPFLGFFTKWIVIQELLVKGSLMMLFIMIMSTLITLFYYLRVIYLKLSMFYFMEMWIMPHLQPTLHKISNILTYINLGMPILMVLIFLLN
uniref:NADH-ubiquinone oxidoreductase chain 2 n=1 Tax=Pedetontus zhejiangensis TaxID=554671 RepID=A0A7L8EZJ5_9INSE|nr:NADH dehydrogenase subunit 2 [Pedetontus zhejiangensis]QOE17733.1 NADH dehydrogenase subunit 2 [Pedetontus zhejiangensis]